MRCFPFVFLSFVLAAGACRGASPEAPGSRLSGSEAPASEAAAREPAADHAAPRDETSGGCVRAGCGGQLCVRAGEEPVTTCEERPEYACYREARCERQADGTCGFTSTPELERCLASP